MCHTGLLQVLNIVKLGKMCFMFNWLTKLNNINFKENHISLTILTTLVYHYLTN